MGLKRANVSLDSLDREGFRRLTGVEGLSRVLNGIETAMAAGLRPLRLNAVVIRGENDNELKALLHFAVGRGLVIRFIELMPMGPLAGRWRERFVSESEMRERLTGAVAHWKESPANFGGPTSPCVVGRRSAGHGRVHQRNELPVLPNLQPDPLYRKIARHLPRGTEPADFVVSVNIEAVKRR